MASSETSSTTMGQRIFAASGAILFFVTSIALTIVVIYTVTQDNKQAQPDTSCDAKAAKQGKLEGQKLCDFTPVDSVATLKTTDLQKGNGEAVKAASDTVTADYTGALAKTGVIFQSSLDSGQPFTSALSGVISGWQQGMIGMKEGGVRRMYIPAAQAYGSQAQSNIPANSDLVFDIYLRRVDH
jgi:FKBP-type peptidyl-prolyl cis-trans isomerase